MNIVRIQSAPYVCLTHAYKHVETIWIHYADPLGPFRWLFCWCCCQWHIMLSRANIICYIFWKLAKHILKNLCIIHWNRRGSVFTIHSLCSLHYVFHGLLFHGGKRPKFRGFKNTTGGTNEIRWTSLFMLRVKWQNVIEGNNKRTIQLVRFWCLM